MSTRDSQPTKAGRRKSLFLEAQERFLGADHVGNVRHFEGLDFDVMIVTIRQCLAAEESKFEEQIEEIGGRRVYTNVASVPPENELTLWITATEVEAVGVVLDAELFHSTELSAVADEQLSRFIGEIQERVTKQT